MPRIYYPDLVDSSRTFSLPERQAQHIRVLRLREGEVLTLFNGKGLVGEATIQRIDKKSVEVSCSTAESVQIPQIVPVHLAMSLINRDQMDWVIQKSVELGVQEITPVIAERTQGRLSTEQIEKRMQHWLEIMIAACEQSGCNFLPQLHSPCNLEKFCQLPSDTLKLILDPYAQNTLHNLTLNTKALSLLIGPEGGLTPTEIEQAQAAGFIGIKLHEQILRAETAAITSIAITQFYFSAK